MNNIDDEKNNIQVSLQKYLNIFSLETSLSQQDIFSLLPSNNELELARCNPKNLIEYEKTQYLCLKAEGYFKDTILKYYSKKLYPLLRQEFFERVGNKMFDEILEFIFPNYLVILKNENQTIKSTNFPEIKLICNCQKELIVVIKRKRKKLNESIKQGIDFLIGQSSPSMFDLSSEPHHKAVKELLIRSLVVMVREYGIVNLLKMDSKEFSQILEFFATSDNAKDFLIKKMIEDIENRLSTAPLKFIQDDLPNYSLENLEYIFGFKNRKATRTSNKYPKRKYLRSLESGTFIEKPLFKRSNLESAALGYVVKVALEALLNVDQWQLDEFGRYCFIQTFKNGNYLKFSFNEFEFERNHYDNDLVKEILLINDSRFWVDIAKVHLLFSAYTTTDKRSYLHPLYINASDIISHLGWDGRHDINQLEKLEYLGGIIDILGKLKVLFSWNCSRDSYTCSPHPVWRTFIHFEREQDKFGDYKNPEYVVIKLEPGIWTEVFLNPSITKKVNTLCQWAYLPLDILQIDSYHKNLEARLALFLTSNVNIHPKKRPYKVKNLLTKVGIKKDILVNNHKDQERKSKARFIKALKFLEKLGWKINIEKPENNWLSQTIFIERSELYPIENKLKFRRSFPKRIPQPFLYRWKITHSKNETSKYEKFAPIPPNSGDIKEGAKTILFFDKSYSPLVHKDQKQVRYCFVDIKSLKKQKPSPVLRPVTGEQLKAARIKRKEKPAYTASCLGVSLSTYNRIENCDRELKNEELEEVHRHFTEEEIFSDDRLLLPKHMLFPGLWRD